MKKLLVFAVVAASFASCSNGEGDKKVEEVKDSTTITTTTPMMSDSMHKDSSKSMMMSTDSMHKDSTKK